MEQIRVFCCNHIGVAGTTKVYVKKTNDIYEARVGIAIMGCTNMPEEELENANPFDDDFYDNYALGKGKTEEEAIKNLKKDMQQTAKGLWAI